jgi:hypothetical protein
VAEVVRQPVAERHQKSARKPRTERTGGARVEKYDVVTGAQKATIEQGRRRCRRAGKKQSGGGLTAKLQAACRRSAAAYAIFWTPDDSGVLSAGGCYVSAEYASLLDSKRGDRESFLGTARSAKFGPGEGLPGRVLSTQDQELVSDVGATPSDGFLHGKCAKTFGIRTIAAIYHDGGVLECGTTEVWATFPKLTPALQFV